MRRSLRVFSKLGNKKDRSSRESSRRWKRIKASTIKVAWTRCRATMKTMRHLMRTLNNWTMIQLTSLMKTSMKMSHSDPFKINKTIQTTTSRTIVIIQFRIPINYLRIQALQSQICSVTRTRICAVWTSSVLNLEAIRLFSMKTIQRNKIKKMIYLRCQIHWNRKSRYLIWLCLNSVTISIFKGKVNSRLNELTKWWASMTWTRITTS